VVSARYYFRQNLDILIDTLLRAWAVHGASAELYLDNAKVYHATALKAACFRLGIRLIHRTARDAAPGGLIERFFETAQDQFETEVRAGPILTLAQLNRAFAAWLEMSYHRRINAETGESPQQRYQSGLRALRRVDMTEAARSFMNRRIRRVDPDFCDVRLDGRFYRVDRKLRGDKIEIRYDPYSSRDSVLIYSLNDQYLGKGQVHHRQKGDAPGGEPPAPKVQYSYLDLLIRQHEQELARQSRGIDYRTLTPRRPWPFPAFAETFARLLGRRGGLSGFAAGELEKLKKIYNRRVGLNESMLVKACEQAREKSLSAVASELEHLLTLRKDEDACF
jgi:hypothetical protein